MRNSKGFTLVELLVVVGIIGVLASVSIVSVNSVRQKGRDAKRISEVKEMQTAMEAYYSSNNSYPLGTAAAAETTLGKTTKLVLCTTTNADTLGFTDAAANCTGSPFMQKVPMDSLSPTSDYKYTAKTCAGGNAPVAPCSSYELTATLEAGTGNFKAGVITASPNGIVGQ